MVCGVGIFWCDLRGFFLVWFGVFLAWFSALGFGFACFGKAVCLVFNFIYNG